MHNLEWSHNASNKHIAHNVNTSPILHTILPIKTLIITKFKLHSSDELQVNYSMHLGRQSLKILTMFNELVRVNCYNLRHVLIEG